MRQFPTDPVAQYQRHFDAVLQDFASPEFLRTGRTPNADRVAEIARQMREKE